MVELLVNGRLVGVFSSEDAAREYCDRNDEGTYSIVPLGTFLETDIEEE